MSTRFDSLYSNIRYLVIRRNDSNILPDAEIDLAIEHIIEFDFVNGFSVSGNTPNKIIDPDLTQDQKKLLILKTALSILIPEDAFSYRTVSLSKFIEGTPGLEDQKEDLKRRVRELESGGSLIAVDSINEFDSYINRADRLDTTISEAQSNG
jgi:hypothetical protein